MIPLNRAAPLFAALALLAACVPPALAGDDDGRRRNRTVHFTTGSGIDLYAGGTLTITQPSRDDIFAGGGSVVLSGATAEKMIVAGGTVTFRDTTAGDVIAAGGDVDAGGYVGDDLIAFGGRVSVPASATVESDTIVAGGQLLLNGTFGGDLIASGGHVILGGTVNGNARLRSPSITLSPGASVMGDLTYSSPEELSLPEGATVGGRIIREDWRGSRMRERMEERSIWHWVALGLVAFAGILSALFLFSAAMIALFPALLGRAATIYGERIFQSLGIGFALSVAVPVAVVLLCLTVIGIPLGLFAAAAYALFLGLGAVTAAFWLGLMIRALLKRPGVVTTTGQRIGWTFAGLFVFAAAGMIPLVGNVAQTLVFLAGLGALAAAAWTRHAEA